MTNVLHRQELLNLTKHQNSPLVLKGSIIWYIHVTPCCSSLVLHLFVVCLWHHIPWFLYLQWWWKLKRTLMTPKGPYWS